MRSILPDCTEVNSPLSLGLSRRAAFLFYWLLVPILLLFVMDDVYAAVRLSFLGAAGDVGGSAYLIESENSKVLVDFGLHYGDDLKSRNEQLQLDPGVVDAVILTHGHIDHVGRVPMLYKNGFRGRVVATDATKSIATQMLGMSYRIGKSHGADLYGYSDLKETLKSIQPVPYDTVEKLPGGMEVRLRDAGHIMGSSIAEVWTRGRENFKIVFSGDLGQQVSPLLRNPAVIEDADYVLVESTYGDLRRPPSEFTEFGAAIRQALAAGGSVLIPAFALEKTQKVLYVLGALKREGIIPGAVPVFVDSSTARKLNKIYRKHAAYYDAEAAKLSQSGDPLLFPGLKEVTQKEALWNHRSGQPAIYVSSSGMLDHAGAPKHLAAMVDDPRNLLAIVGWQAPGSVGRKLQEGGQTIDIPIESYNSGKPKVEWVRKPVKMTVRTFGQFSSHADGCEILSWLSHLHSLRKVFVVHGERTGSERLARLIEGKLGVPASVPAEGGMVLLGQEKPVPVAVKTGDLCDGLEAGAGVERDGAE